MASHPPPLEIQINITHNGEYSSFVSKILLLKTTMNQLPLRSHFFLPCGMSRDQNGCGARWVWSSLEYITLSQPPPSKKFWISPCIKLVAAALQLAIVVLVAWTKAVDQEPHTHWLRGEEFSVDTICRNWVLF